MPDYAGLCSEAASPEGFEQPLPDITLFMLRKATCSRALLPCMPCTGGEGQPGEAAACGTK